MTEPLTNNVRSVMIVSLLTRASMIVAIVIVALLVAFIALENRRAFAELEQLRAEDAAMEMHWSRLLLEKGALLSPAKLEKIAIKGMGMHRPSPSAVIVVTP